MRFLITGAGGFVGLHLAAYLDRAEPRAQLFGTTLFPTERVHPAVDENHLIDLKDVRESPRPCSPTAGQTPSSIWPRKPLCPAPLKTLGKRWKTTSARN